MLLEPTFSKSSLKIFDDLELRPDNDQEVLHKINRQEGGIHPGFVVKTSNAASSKRYAQGLKVFINIVYSDNTPRVLETLNAELVARIRRGREVEVPLVVSSPVNDMDKAGKECIVFSTCVNTDFMDFTGASPDMRLFLIENCMTAIEKSYPNIVLSRGELQIL